MKGAVHTEQTFKCGVCDKQLKSKGYLTKHSQTHTATKVKCVLCNNFF